MNRDDMIDRVKAAADLVVLPPSIGVSVRPMLSGAEVRVYERHQSRPIPTSISIASVIDALEISSMLDGMFIEVVRHHIEAGVEKLKRARRERIRELVLEANESIYDDQGDYAHITLRGAEALKEAASRLIEDRDSEQ